MLDEVALKRKCEVKANKQRAAVHSLFIEWILTQAMTETFGCKLYPTCNKEREFGSTRSFIARSARFHSNVVAVKRPMERNEKINHIGTRL
ncbi:hypothetical protein F2P81_004471 [Scophthalmus maximus]|uniref:Uncharacterized protein n=1 Tax=Scophthalmus maximus TaxID=52904 RepID=A0A6A4TIU8_SCOMX|nr:hypothetical protein F2P81_004471 [Scophthalmus maximus]